MNRNDPSSLADRLLDQDVPPSTTEFEEYRKNIQQAIVRAEQRKTFVGRLAMVALILATALMFIGGSQVVGSFDPTDKEATPLSMTLGFIYIIAAVTAPLAIASYYSRFGPRVRKAKERLRDAAVEELRLEIHELQQQLANKR